MRGVFELLKNRPLIRTVEAMSCNLNEDGGMNIASALPHVLGLETLLIGDCKFGSDACMEIFNGLSKNKSLKRLNLSNNSMTGNIEFENYQYEVGALVALKKALSVNTTIEELDISDNG